MCAIAGIIGMELNETQMRHLLATMAKRGPDDNGTYSDNESCLLHSRLAIIDPEGGKQPMSLDWKGETYVLVYNGELYNTEEIRQMLRGKGHQFEGHSDTEAVIHAYAEFGEKCLALFNGIFAFALWEKKRKRLFLARDRMGVKPLFYSEQGNILRFASEIKTILACPRMTAELDREGAAQIILFGPGRIPGSGIFRGIRELEPGWCGYFQHGKLQMHSYWKLTDGEHRDSFQETVSYVRELVLDAIKRQMVSDVPVGTFLSGGLDSSVITAVCAGEMECRGEKLHTFSVDYENNEKYFRANKFQPNSDSHYIGIMEKTLHTQHHRTVLSAKDLTDSLEQATIARDLPGMADVDFSLLRFCAEIRNHVKVALSGECADEIFGGYPWYRDPEIRAQAGFPWAQNTKQRIAMLHPSVREKLDCRELVNDAYLDTCRSSDILPSQSPTERRMKEMMNLNFRWFMQTLLDRKDRMSMYHSLEVRVPFCDHRIAEYLYRVPWEFKDFRGKEKGLLRMAMEGILPEEILWRKKSPYPKTFDPAYADMVSQKVRMLLQNREAPVFSLVDSKAVEELFVGEPVWPWYGQLMRTPQTFAYLLQIDFWMRHYNISICF